MGGGWTRNREKVVMGGGGMVLPLKQLSGVFDFSSLLRSICLERLKRTFCVFPLPFHSLISDFRSCN